MLAFCLKIFMYLFVLWKTQGRKLHGKKKNKHKTTHTKKTFSEKISGYMISFPSY